MVLFPAAPSPSKQSPRLPDLFTITIANIRIDASSIASGTGAPTAVTETLFLSGAAVTPTVLQSAAVAYVVNGLAGVQASGVSSIAVCIGTTTQAPAFSIQFGEGFATAFKTQGSAAANSAVDSWYNTNTESGFGVISGQASNTASSGPRVKIVFNNVPANVSMYVPLTITNSGGTMTLTASETGAFSAVSASVASDAPAATAAIPIVGGSATVIYEETTGASGAVETYKVPVYISAGANAVTSQVSAITATVSLAPTGTPGNIPNFVNGTSAATLSLTAFLPCGTAAIPQTIQFASPPNATASSGSVSLTATSSSGLAVTFTSASPGVCSGGREILPPGPRAEPVPSPPVRLEIRTMRRPFPLPEVSSREARILRPFRSRRW